MVVDIFDWHARFSQQARWTAPLRRYLLDQVRPGPQSLILEVGCGTGAVLAALKSELSQSNGNSARPGTAGTGGLPLPRGVVQPFASARLHGLDINLAFLTQAARNAPAAHFVQGDAYQLPYASASCDLLVCHYLLLWLKDPQAALAEMRRVARPGGWVCALAEPDYGGRIDYPDELVPLGQAQRKALRRQGADPDLGRKVAGLFQKAGLQPVEYGLLAGRWHGAPSPQEQALEWAVLAQDLAGWIPDPELARLKTIEGRAWQSGERTLFIPTFYFLGKKPAN
jgi:SAM-dependent methyltransferase